MNNPFDYTSTAKTINLGSNINPFSANSTLTTTRNQSNTTSYQNTSTNAITNYFAPTTGNSTTSSVPSPFTTTTNLGSAVPSSSFNPFNKPPSTTSSSNLQGLNLNNPFLSQGTANPVGNGTNPFPIQSNPTVQSNPFQTASNYGNTMSGSTNAFNTGITPSSNPFTVNTNASTTTPIGGMMGGSGQQYGPFNASNQNSTNKPFTTTSNTTNMPNSTNNPFSVGGNTNTFLKNTTSTNQYAILPNQSTASNPFNINSTSNNSNPFSTSQQPIINNPSSQGTLNMNTTSFNPTNPMTTNNQSPFQTSNSTTNQPKGFTPSVSTATPSFQQPQGTNTSSNPFNQTQSNPFNIQPASNPTSFNAPIYSYPTTTPFPQQQQSNPYPSSSQLPYDLQYAPIFINQNYNYLPNMSQTIEDIESKYLAQFINDSIMNKEREQKEKMARERLDINSLLANREDNHIKSYYLPSYHQSNKENEIDFGMPDYLKEAQLQPRLKKTQINSTQHKVNLRTNTKRPSVRPFRLSSNSQSTNKKNYSLSNLSQSSMSSSSRSGHDGNYEYEVTIQFENPIRLTKVMRTRRYLNKDQVVKDIIDRFKERRYVITSKDFILLLNGVVIGNEPKQIDLSKEAFSFSEVDSTVKKIAIAGYFYQNRTDNVIMEEDPQTEHQDESFSPVKDDFYPKTAHFITSPSMNELSSMSKSQLEQVNNFSIANSHAKIFFDHPCDLTYVDLDCIKIDNYLLITIQKHNMFIDKLRMKCTVEFFNILLDDTSFYQMNEVKKLCEANLKSDQFHYVRELEKLIVVVDLTKL